MNASVMYHRVTENILTYNYSMQITLIRTEGDCATASHGIIVMNVCVFIPKLQAELKIIYRFDTGKPNAPSFI